MNLQAGAFERICKIVYERSAIVLDPGKEYLVVGRLTAVAQANGFADVNELCAKLDARNQAMVWEVVEAMTTNETSFYRDHHPFEALRQTVIPQLIKDRKLQRRLRFWCAACSTGQEPYSLAMLLDQYFPLLASWDVSILATDLSKAVLARAIAGRYRQIEVNRGLSAAALVRYFRRDGLEWEISPDLRRVVSFEELNLVGTWPRAPLFDLVFLRNVLIYFDQPTKLSVLGKVRKQVAADGYLVLGGSETTPSELTSFERMAIPRAGLYRAVPAATGGSSAR